MEGYARRKTLAVCRSQHPGMCDLRLANIRALGRKLVESLSYAKRDHYLAWLEAGL
jgi:hypothetical protein